MPEGTAVAPARERGRVRTPAQVYAVAAVSALGGLLFGYDTGIISGALLCLRQDLHLSSRGQEIVVSVILVGAMIGALVTGRLAGRLGRRRVVLWVAVVFTVGALGAAAAPVRPPRPTRYCAGCVPRAPTSPARSPPSATSPRRHPGRTAAHCCSPGCAPPWSSRSGWPRSPS
jgi:nitrate/nitrite transporter NarK